MARLKSVILRITAIGVAYFVIVKILIATNYSSDFEDDQIRSNFEIVKSFKKRISKSIQEFVDESPTSKNGSAHSVQIKERLSTPEVYNPPDWQQLGKSKQIAVYSAHGLLNEKIFPKVTILATFTGNVSLPRVRCKYFYKDTHKTPMAPGKLEISADLITCPLPVGSKYKSLPEKVSVLVETQTWTSKTPLKIHYQQVPPPGSRSLSYDKNITACVATTEYPIDFRKFVTWLEIQKSFGVDRFILFNGAIDKQQSCQIDALRNIPSVKIEVLPWRKYAGSNETSDALKACILISKGTKSKWIIYGNLQEILFSSNYTSYTELIANLEERMTNLGYITTKTSSEYGDKIQTVGVIPDLFNLYSDEPSNDVGRLSFPKEIAEIHSTSGNSTVIDELTSKVIADVDQEISRANKICADN